MSAGKHSVSESVPGQDRIEPGGELDERAMLAGWLDYHRATLRGKCFGLTDEELRRRAVPPSGLSLLGLVRHLADVERHWFSRVLAGTDAPPLFYSDAEPDGEFTGVDDASVAEAFTAWAAQCETSRAVVAGLESIDVGCSHARRGDLTARWVLTHMLEEYARHNGHADLLRECIDGVTGE